VVDELPPQDANRRGTIIKRADNAPNVLARSLIEPKDIAYLLTLERWINSLIHREVVSERMPEKDWLHGMKCVGVKDECVKRSFHSSDRMPGNRDRTTQG